MGSSVPGAMGRLDAPTRLSFVQSAKHGLDNRQMMRGFGERLRWLREEYELREPLHHGQWQWAMWIGVSHPVYSKWEKGTNFPSLYHLTRIADLFQVSTDYLLRGVVGRPTDHRIAAALLASHPAPLLTPVAKFEARRSAERARFEQSRPPKRKFPARPKKPPAVLA